MSDILNKILAVKREEVAAAAAIKPLALVRAEAEAQSTPRDFVGALHARIAAGQAAVIVEIKKASAENRLKKEPVSRLLKVNEANNMLAICSKNSCFRFMMRPVKSV